jgi:hypothetical protein
MTTGEYTSSALAAKAFKDAFFAAAVTNHASDNGVRVSYGHPGSGTRGVDDLIAVKNVRVTADWGPMGIRHARDVILELDVEYSAFISGVDDDDKSATDRAYALLDVDDAYCRRAPAYNGDSTLGGVVRDCMLTSSESAGVTDNAFLAQGRLIVVLATFTARARITD